jgi:hypothetical protein
MSDPKTDCEMLLGALLPFAEKMLAEHGEFYPFAATMSDAGECEMAAVADDGEEPSPQQLIDLYVEQFRTEAKTGEFKATAIIYHATTIPPGKTQEENTVIGAVDHRGGFSAKICFPYSLQAGQLKLQKPYAAAGNNQIFGTKE